MILLIVIVITTPPPPPPPPHTHTHTHSPDPTLTVENVSRVMEKVESIKRMDVWKGGVVSFSLVKKIQEQYSTATEREAAYVDHFLNIDPESSWVHLAQELYYHQQVAAVEEVKSYLPPRGES